MQLAKLPRQKGRIPMLRCVGKKGDTTQCAVCVSPSLTTNVHTLSDQTLGLSNNGRTLAL